MTKTQIRRPPPTQLSKEQQDSLASGIEARKTSLENDAENGNISRSIENPNIGRPEMSKESAKKKEVTKDGTS